MRAICHLNVCEDCRLEMQLVFIAPHGCSVGFAEVQRRPKACEFGLKADSFLLNKFASNPVQTNRQLVVKGNEREGPYYTSIGNGKGRCGRAAI